MTPFVADVKRNYIFGGICGIAANLSIKVCRSLRLYSNFCCTVEELCGNLIITYGRDHYSP